MSRIQRVRPSSPTSPDEVYKLEVFGNGSVTIWKFIPESKLDQL